MEIMTLNFNKEWNIIGFSIMNGVQTKVSAQEKYKFRSLERAHTDAMVS